MHLLLQVVLFVLAFIFHEHGAAIAQINKPTYTSAVVPVTKHTDSATPLYSMAMTHYSEYIIHTNFLIDLDAPLIWYNCDLDGYLMAHCSDLFVCPSPVQWTQDLCTRARATASSSSSYQSSQSCSRPVSNDTVYWGKPCTINVANPVAQACDQDVLTEDYFSVNGTDGRNPLPDLYSRYSNAVCAFLFDFFPAGVNGVMALSSSPFALPAYVNEPLDKILALCLPSSSSTPGVIFLGNGPYYLLPQSNVDIRSILSYTQLVKYPNSFGYFISVKAILINGKPIHLLKQGSLAKISTITPYTTLRTDVYRSLIDSFSNAAKKVPRAHPIRPFDVCFNTTTVGRTRVGLKVPHVSFYLENGLKWTVFGANSMKQVSKDVACLGFVDGGLKADHEIVIGTLQIEDNFLLFDLENFSLGFSSSLLYKKTSCANFNFTTGI